MEGRKWKEIAIISIIGGLLIMIADLPLMFMLPVIVSENIIGMDVVKYGLFMRCLITLIKSSILIFMAILTGELVISRFSAPPKKPSDGVSN